MGRPHSSDIRVAELVIPKYDGLPVKHDQLHPARELVTGGGISCRGIAAVIPVKEDQKKHRPARGRAGGRPPAFDAARYEERNTAGRCFAKLRQFRAVATRYDKRDLMCQGTVDVASIRVWLRDPVP